MLDSTEMSVIPAVYGIIMFPLAAAFGAVVTRVDRSTTQEPRPEPGFSSDVRP
ncbi:hypothetical protein QSJ19_17075 [Gordonia sp. ABSL11-1]|uniref:hypothetical protein n=1 Tax=Gordonia sp. ABSL11-1 TaxID=3053924 RepID=UPI0025748EF9|nr:hypothetical protein [Gordonia sp. ABSL11-1]MDL9947259.1 hypothetical protein [Gordonia sp. ABSL11-1]